MVVRRVLSEPMRLRILNLLQDGEKCVQELVEATQTSQANVSKHLKVMLQAGILTRRTEGTSAFYGVADDLTFELCQYGMRVASPPALKSRPSTSVTLASPPASKARHPTLLKVGRKAHSSMLCPPASKICANLDLLSRRWEHLNQRSVP